ncbi:MAG: helix-turn-helix domain-containing protein [Minisyncoccales bacterium]
MKLKEKIKAIHLRKLGKSYSEIRRIIKVSKSTLSLWLRDIKLTPIQEKRIYVELRQKNAYKLAKLSQKRRIEKTKKIFKEAEKEIPVYFKNSLFLSGLMLYWAEGDKSKSNEHVKFTNSDNAMIMFIMKWFRKICKVPETKFRVCLHIHKLHCRKNIEQYWSHITGIPLSQFYKTQVKPTSLKQRRNKLYDGTCAITVCNKDLFRKIEGWKLGFLKKMDIKNKNNSESP